ncbi:sugar-binding transcriptional regulator [Oceanobacillus oncorhynchi subsp. oncorhynchi]|uniref:sugar-binding transcriptional regulator n=1 Tax=Oceanobacillus oncorhynchi TaxID=545501 RepID=UPI0031E1E8CE
MDNLEEERTLLKLAQMYYEKDMTQSEIAKELEINRSTISRMLKKVRDKGIVTTVINYDMFDTFTVEEQLKERFQLKDAIVVPVGEEHSKETKLLAMGQACANYLNQVVQNQDVIGFSWGTGLSKAVEQLDTTSKKDVLCVPMIGGPSGKLESKYHVNTICYKAAEKFNAQSLMIDLPAILDNKETRNQILKSGYFEEISTVWNLLTVAVFGIGSMEISGERIWKAFYGNAVTQEFKRDNIVGDICSHFFDIDGNVVQTSVTDRTINIGLDKIRNARYSIGVAESREKVNGIIGALNSGLMKVLVTTEETAKLILEKSS